MISPCHWSKRVAADKFATGPGAKGVIGLVVDGSLDEAGAAIAKQEIAAAGMHAFVAAGAEPVGIDSRFHGVQGDHGAGKREILGKNTHKSALFWQGFTHGNGVT